MSNRMETSPRSYEDSYEVGKSAADRLGNILGRYTEKPREAVRSAFRKAGRGAVKFLGAGIISGEKYVSNVQSNVDTIRDYRDAGVDKFVANPIATASEQVSLRRNAVRNFFENRKDKRAAKAAGRELSGLEGQRDNIDNQIDQIEQQLAALRKQKRELGKDRTSLTDNMTEVESQRDTYLEEIRQRREQAVQDKADAEARREERINRQRQSRQSQRRAAAPGAGE